MSRQSEISYERQRCEESINNSYDRIAQYRGESESLQAFLVRMNEQEETHYSEIQRGASIIEGFTTDQIEACRTARVYSEGMGEMIRGMGESAETRYQNLRDKIQRELQSLDSRIEEETYSIQNKRSHISRLNEEEKQLQQEQVEREALLAKEQQEEEKRQKELMEAKGSKDESEGDLLHDMQKQWEQILERANNKGNKR